MGWNDHLADPDSWEEFLEAALGVWDNRDKTRPVGLADDVCDCGCQEDDERAA